MYCKNCGAEVNENAAACLSCGANPKVGNKYCANCGKEVNQNQVVCLSCGAKISGNGGSQDFGNYSKVTMALVCFFLGGLGIHNFMLGETKKGIVKIVASCLCGLGSILALIDFIRILTDNYEVNPEKMF
ncbi:MAG: TM2 domain-containing protein [Clostridium sp.]|nr:TM2 domain-containing protein [Clostridium sp.]MCM1547892.1 TM2 domain-containing protein [Ruminococcus sp.]